MESGKIYNKPVPHTNIVFFHIEPFIPSSTIHVVVVVVAFSSIYRSILFNSAHYGTKAIKHMCALHNA